MARLPVPGSDKGQWGEVLNTFLSESHTSTGSLKPAIVEESHLDSAVAAKLNQVDDLSTVARTGSYADLLNKPVIPISQTASVLVVTGSEVRPTASTVFWIGGVAQPTNMITGDLWFTPNAPGDTTAPSVPTGLTASNITSSGFTVSWTPATDTVGVTGYEVRLGGVGYNTTLSPTLAITGRSGNTPYVVTVRARDAAGNWSAESAPITVTTTTAILTQHNVFGSSPYPAAMLKYNEGDIIRVATGFIVSTSTGWKIKGARVYIPAGITVPQSLTVYAFMPVGMVPDLASPVSIASIGNVVVGQWNEATFTTASFITPGQPFWIGYQFGDGTYLSSSSGALSDAEIHATDGSDLSMMDRFTYARNYYRLGTGSTTASGVGGQGYGIDVIVSEV